MRRPRDDRNADAFNGEIVSYVESYDPEDYVGLDNLRSERATELIAKRTEVIRRRARYLKAKKIAEQKFFSRKTSRSVRGIMKQHPDIGQVMEYFVQQRNIGADRWMRMGVLTFDGNTNMKEKVTSTHP